MDETFKLSPREHEQIFKLIENDWLRDSTSVTHPRVFITGGQPASGKSKLLELSKKEFADGNVVVINGDELRAFHPRADEILRLDDKRFAEFTDPDVRQWTKDLFGKAIQSKRNIVFESTMRESGPISQTMVRLKNDGYAIIIKIVATNERFSKTGIFRRYEEQKAAKGYGRFSEISSHDAAYKGMPVTVQTIEETKLANTILIYARSARQLYRNNLQKNSWQSDPQAQDAYSAQSDTQFRTKKHRCHEAFYGVAKIV